MWGFILRESHLDECSFKSSKTKGYERTFILLADMVVENRDSALQVRNRYARLWGIYDSSRLRIVVVTVCAESMKKISQAQDVVVFVNREEKFYPARAIIRIRMTQLIQKSLLMAKKLAKMGHHEITYSIPAASVLLRRCRKKF